MQAFPAIEVRKVATSSDLLQPGDFVVIPKREPERTFETQPIAPPATFGAWLKWRFLGPRETVKQIIETQWPEYDAIITICPTCRQACATSKHHVIVSLDPLTVETPITCPYCRNKSFQVKEGVLTAA